MLNLPIIDISPVFAPNQEPAAKQLIAQQIDKACREVGFFLITGHGVTKEFISEFYSCLRQFFNLPLEEKSKYILSKHESGSYNYSCPYGYSTLASENAYAFMGKKGPNDIVEKISTGPDILKDETASPIDWLPNNEESPNLKQVMREYYERFREIGVALSKLFALAVNLPEDFFIDKMDKAQDSFRCHSYPKIENTGNNGFASHTDLGLLTLVSQEEGCNGLEVFDKDTNCWQLVEIPAIDTFVVNIGDLMMRWSNNQWISNEHRVILNNHPRFSTAFFKVVNEDATIECFPEFTKTRPAMYQPITFREFALTKMVALASSSTASADEQEEKKTVSKKISPKF